MVRKDTQAGHADAKPLTLRSVGFEAHQAAMILIYQGANVMDAAKECRYDSEYHKAIYVVRADDVLLLAGKAGVAITKKAAEEWLAENWDVIEEKIDDFITKEVAK
jgi:hypothetical protein